MKRLVKLYPREWRDRYGAEFEYTLEQTPFTLPNLLDTLKGALLMQLNQAKNQ